ncbi:MAG: carbamoyltransferase HypF [Anaerolineae bacterium]|nr:carbamoyltransferase HypF [Anaerolineae bacterium]
MTAPDRSRLRVVIRGAVQGVGFRPFVYRLAADLGLPGWVINSTQGVFIEVEGDRATLQDFLRRLETDKPPRAFIQSLEHALLDPVGFVNFEIRHSDESGPRTALILPDIATCPDCQREIFDPADRRHRYPFTNCTNCGPRYSIILALPYDRPNTTMRGFVMCPACRAEYENPLDRRFHAQPNACPVCGPQLALWNAAGETLAERDDALRAAEHAIRQGQIVAIKGLGGFHLVVDARNAYAVNRLRARKGREEKAFALMLPDLDTAAALCRVSPAEARLLRSPEAPIVLLEKREAAGELLAESVAPRNPYLGVMLPYTPLHHLLMADLGAPIVATSGNLSDEPICIDERDALERLGGIADVFLVHNRPIARHVDDSIARIALDRELILRRARGYAPLPVTLPERAGSFAAPVVAVGAHLKNTAALAIGRDVFASQHIGDLETEGALMAFRRVIADLTRLYDARPGLIAADLHPDYLSTAEAARLAEQSGASLVQVQHHHAHVLACMADNDLPPDTPVLGVSWDGTGYGTDGTVWGGEFLTEGGERLAHLATFRLPGGEKAIREPRRTALGMLYAVFGESALDRDDLPPVASFSPAERAVLRAMLARGTGAPLTSSAGRLFDGVAALIGLRQKLSYEGQAAMELEYALAGITTDECYDYQVTDVTNPDFSGERHVKWIVDWSPALRAVLDDVRQGVAPGLIAARFHNTLSECIVAVARRAGRARVILSGGVFQNRALLERTVRRLGAEGFRPYWHQRLPPNDGGIAVGQAVGALIGSQQRK